MSQTCLTLLVGGSKADCNFVVWESVSNLDAFSLEIDSVGKYCRLFTAQIYFDCCFSLPVWNGTVCGALNF